LFVILIHGRSIRDSRISNFILFFVLRICFVFAFCSGLPASSAAAAAAAAKTQSASSSTQQQQQQQQQQQKSQAPLPPQVHQQGVAQSGNYQNMEDAADADEPAGIYMTTQFVCWLFLSHRFVCLTKIIFHVCLFSLQSAS
jgi:hypothetical protein